MEIKKWTHLVTRMDSLMDLERQMVKVSHLEMLIPKNLGFEKPKGLKRVKVSQTMTDLGRVSDFLTMKD